MPKKKTTYAKGVRFKKPVGSPIKWNENEGVYEMKCGACKKKVYSPNLKNMTRTFTAHTKSDECLGGY